MRTLLSAALLATTLLPAVATAAAPDAQPQSKPSLSLARDMEEVWHVGVLAIDKWPGLQHFNIRPGLPETTGRLDFDLSSHTLSDTGSGLQETADSICQIGNDLTYDWHYTWTVEIMGHDRQNPHAELEIATCTIGSNGVSKYR